MTISLYNHKNNLTVMIIRTKLLFYLVGNPNVYMSVHTSKITWVPFSNQNGFMKVDWYGRKRLLITPRSLLINTNLD